MRRQPVILVAEDDLNDALLLQLAFQRSAPKARLRFVRDGDEAINYLRSEPPFDNRAKHPWPDLLVLDLRMPGVTGFDVLEWLRQRRDLKPTGLVVLSGSNSQADIDRAYSLGAHFFFTKPLEFERLVAMAEDLKERCSLAPAFAATEPESIR